jgi:hypothetical protein
MRHGKDHDRPSVKRKKKFVGLSTHSGTKLFFPWRRGRHDRLTIPVKPVVNPIT